MAQRVCFGSIFLQLECLNQPLLAPPECVLGVGMTTGTSTLPFSPHTLRGGTWGEDWWDGLEQGYGTKPAENNVEDRTDCSEAHQGWGCEADDLKELSVNASWQRLWQTSWLGEQPWVSGPTATISVQPNSGQVTSGIGVASTSPDYGFEALLYQGRGTAVASSSPSSVLSSTEWLPAERLLPPTSRQPSLPKLGKHRRRSSNRGSCERKAAPEASGRTGRYSRRLTA